ncbi:MAG: peptidylprolyl isomerase [Clostridia bacterium]|nr:peptidylprolyl isomerase [Clostridia bacterium]
MDENKYEDTEEITDLVRLNVSYTDSDGQKYTGDILVQLDADEAPITVANFQELVSEGFYDGLTFHRVMENFMIQGGDPKGNGTGGSDKDIVGEFSANGIENNIAHVRGTISMAREGERYDSNGNVISTGYDTASSQFFIVHKTSTNNTLSLDGKYAAFGQVIFGMETVDGIATLDTDSNNKPLETVKINSATFVKEK